MGGLQEVGRPLKSCHLFPFHFVPYSKPFSVCLVLVFRLGGQVLFLDWAPGSCLLGVNLSHSYPVPYGFQQRDVVEEEVRVIRRANWAASSI